MADEEFFTRKGAAAFLARLGCPVAPQTLADMAAHHNAGRGPPFTRALSRIVRYKRGDLESWAAKVTRRIE